MVGRRVELDEFNGKRVEVNSDYVVTVGLINAI